MLDQCINEPVAAAPAANKLLPLEVKDLTLEIGGKRLIDSINLSLASHTITMIMGSNGAGKSLLLRLVHGLLTPTSGDIRWGTAPLSVAIRERQAMVFQRPVLLRRSVAANIDFVLSLRGDATRESRDTLLDHVGLLDRAEQPARLLSGGEQQRLAMARALALAPEVLLLDEPTANFDPATVLKIEQIVRTAHKCGTKIIFVTHDIGQAKRLADEVVFLHNGRVIEQSQAASFLLNPNSEVAQAYLEGRIIV
jgi:tungstate transport system ATP-binding protein